MSNLDDDKGPETEHSHLEILGAAIRTHRTLEDALDDPDGPKFAGIRAALDLDPGGEVARVFEVTAAALPGRPVVREMRYYDGIIPRLTLQMDEDNRVEVAVYSYSTGSLRRYSLPDLVTLCDVAVTASNNAVEAAKQARDNLELAQKFATEADRLRAEVEHLRRLLGDQTPEPSAT